MWFATWKKWYLTQKLAWTDASLRIDRDIWVSEGRLKLKDPNNRDTTYVEWLSFATNTANGDGTYTLGTLVRWLSQTADPATAGTWKTFWAGTECVLVAMHDQLPDKQASNVVFGWDITADDILAWSLGFTSTTKGGLTVNNLTTTQRDALVGVLNGTIIYNTTAWEFQIRQSGSWVTMASGSTQPNASTTVAGKVEISTETEVEDQTDTGWTWATNVITPSLLATPNYIKMIGWEFIVAWDLVYTENVELNQIITTITGTGQKGGTASFWDATATSRRSMRIIGNGVSASSLKLSLRKQWAPTDNLVVRIETDSGWVPSGTLANVASTANVAWAWLTTSLADVTVTFAWSFTLTDGVIYHIVLQRSAGLDAINYYQTGTIAKSVRIFTTNTHNGTAWGTPATSIAWYVSYTGMYQSALWRANATDLTFCYVTGIAILGWSAWTLMNIQTQGIIKRYALLSKDTVYYLSNTPGVYSTTPGTNTIAVGYVDQAGKGFTIINGKDWYAESTAWYLIINSSDTWWKTKCYKIDRPMYMMVYMTWSWFNSFAYKNNTAMSNWVTYFLVPWDSIYIGHTNATSIVFQVSVTVIQSIGKFW